MKVRLSLFFILSIGLNHNSQSQDIPASRTTDWTQPGSVSAFVPSVTVSLKDFGVDSTGIIACDQAFSRALASVQGAKRIKISEGTFLFKQPIILPDSVILEGVADSQTNGIFTTLLLAAGESHGIMANGSESKTTATVVGPLVKDQMKITLTSPAFKAGDFIRLSAMDDSLLVKSSWGIHTTGQIFQITKTDGNDIWLNKPLRRSYDANRLPEIFQINPKKQVHIRSLILKTQLKSSFQTSTIQFKYAANCSVSGIESYMSNFAHVELSNSTHITVEKSYFKDAFTYGNGGAGYGVVMQFTSGDCYIHSNVMEHLRHSILLQAGANGNVTAYNYSFNPYWTGTFFPADAAGDLVLHGNYVYMNLFEGNVMQNIVIDNSHGINGPNNTFFRNRAESYGFVMNNNPASNGQNFVGNQVTSTASLKGNFSLAGTNHFISGNTVKGTINAAGTGEPVAASLYNCTFSSFYSTYSSVPPIKTTNWQESKPLIEAQYNFQNKGMNAVVTSVGNAELSGGNVETESVYPNPFRNEIYVKGGDHKHFRIYDSQGVFVLFGDFNSKIETSQLKAGRYFIEGEGETHMMKVIKE